jgi:hypothetical protein
MQRIYERYCEIVRKYLVLALGSIPLADLEPHCVQSYYGKALISSHKNSEGSYQPKQYTIYYRVL